MRYHPHHENTNARAAIESFEKRTRALENSMPYTNAPRIFGGATHKSEVQYVPEKCDA